MKPAKRPKRAAKASRLSLTRPKPLPNRPSPALESIRFGLYDRYGSHPGHGLTPLRIAEIFRTAEAGYPAVQCDTFDDVVERDAHLRSLLEARLEAVAGKQWIIQAGGEAPADVRAAALLERALRQVPNITETLEHLLTANWYGYAASEIVWEIVDALAVPVWFANVPHRRFVFDAEDSPRLLTEANRTDGIPLERGKWIFHRRRHRKIACAGLMRTATWWSMAKSVAVRDWIVFSERFGLPFVTGRYEDNASDEDKAVLGQALGVLGSDGHAMFSKAMEIVVHQVQSGGKATDVQGALAAFCNAELSKLLSGATLTSESSGPGSYALGTVHRDRSFDLVMGDAERLSIRFEQDVGVPFVHFNGLNARPPRLKIHVIREMDPLTRIKVASTAANELGLDLDEEQMRQEFQLKRPSGGGVLRGTRRGTEAPNSPMEPEDG